MNNNYITCKKEYQNGYYTIPESLHTNPLYQSLSCEAILLYGHLLRRAYLSLQNHMVDEAGRAYVFLTREQAQKICRCKENKATSVCRELSGCGLIDDIPQGKKKANLIYVKFPEDAKPDEQARRKAKEEKKTRAKKAREQLKKLNAAIKAKRMIVGRLDEQLREKRRQFSVDRLVRIEPELIASIQEQIEYGYFVENANKLRTTKEWIDVIVLSMAEMRTAFYTKINGCMISGDDLGQTLDRYDASSLCEFIRYFGRNVCMENIRNLKAYLKAALYNFIQRVAAQEQEWALE